MIKLAFQLLSSDSISRDVQDKVHLIILSSNLLDSLPLSNEIVIHIKSQVPAGAPLARAHHTWREGALPKILTPAKLPRQPGQATCPPDIVHLEIECIQRRNPDMGSYFGFTGYFLSVLVSLSNKAIWDARGQDAT